MFIANIEQILPIILSISPIINANLAQNINFGPIQLKSLKMPSD